MFLVKGQQQHRCDLLLDLCVCVCKSPLFLRLDPGMYIGIFNSMHDLLSVLF